MSKCTDPEFWDERGISKKVRDARPYAYWSPKNLNPIREVYPDLAAVEWLVSKAKESGTGLIIRRRPPRGFASIYPEIRPDNPVITGYTKHYHGDGPCPDPGLYKWFIGTPETMHGHIHKLADGPGDIFPAERPGRDPEKPPIYVGHSFELEAASFDEDGVEVRPQRILTHNPQKVHIHEHKAKYLFAPSPKRVTSYTHTHADMLSENVERHIRNAHRKDDPEALEDYRLLPHAHATTRKNKAVNYAAHIDIHPDALAKIHANDIVFFVIEGCLKADAVLSAGGAAFSVPSVSLWYTPEIVAFIGEVLKDKTVIIVPDADWIKKREVIAQARFCQTYLRAKGVGAYVAAPPEDRLSEGIKGVDDYLGIGGGTLDELEIIDKIIPLEAITDHVADRGGKIDHIRRSLDGLLAIASHADDQGILSAPYATIGRIMAGEGRKVKYPAKRAERALKTLEQDGLIEIRGMLDTRPAGYYSKVGGKVRWHSLPGIEWKSRPEFRITNPALRGKLIRTRLGDLELPKRAA